MVLFCCWVAGKSQSLQPALLTRAHKLSSTWKANVVQPLRSARSWMKNSAGQVEPIATERCLQLRKKIKALELEAEKLQLEALESLIAEEEAPEFKANIVAERAMANLIHYAEADNLDVREEVRELFAMVVAAAFPEGHARKV
jgi:uncharacterized protein (TIGR02444 family)